ncbi:MAG: hypothetical protein JRJ86_11605 [Deltaproteobacteria bacterium]|nr:hypothetical protein [Deltaproteobacteria bacterium]MBW2117274.1 hypothetical protein [Deltaproteobacteria bacterium]MBW2345239.1 hypothetical protein [Deltaproteobacteria bacterium]
MVHRYWEIDYSRMYEIICGVDLDDLVEFIHQIGKLFQKKTEDEGKHLERLNYYIAIRVVKEDQFVPYVFKYSSNRDFVSSSIALKLPSIMTGIFS